MPHVRGTVSMARTDQPDSANSQFFIVFYPRFALDRHYTNFGRVIGGMQYVDAIVRGEPPENPTKILQASMASDNRPQVLPAPVVVAQPDRPRCSPGLNCRPRPGARRRGQGPGSQAAPARLIQRAMRVLRQARDERPTRHAR